MRRPVNVASAGGRLEAPEIRHPKSEILLIRHPKSEIPLTIELKSETMH